MANQETPCIDCGGEAVGIRCDACFEAQVVTAGGRTIGELRAIFNEITDPDNWKGPIEAQVMDHEVEAAREAVAFFTGSVAEFEKTDYGTHIVRAAGYYAAVGA